MTIVWIALGSALGGVARYACSGLIAGLVGETFPWGTLAVNALGSLAIGLIAAIGLPESRIMVPAELRLFLMIGLLGGFTTFSSFSLQTLALLQDGEWLQAGGYILASVLLCLVAVWAGWALGVGLAR